MGKLHKLIAAAFGINLLHFASNASAQGTSYAKQEWPAYQKNELEELWLEGGVGQGYTSGGSSFRIQLLTNFLIFINQCEGREFNDSPAAEWIRLVRFLSRGLGSRAHLCCTRRRITIWPHTTSQMTVWEEWTRRPDSSWTVLRYVLYDTFSRCRH